MDGKDLRTIRKRLGLTVMRFANALGYRGNENSRSTQVRMYEAGKRPIPPWIARLASMYGRYGVPPEFLDPPPPPDQPLDEHVQ